MVTSGYDRRRQRAEPPPVAELDWVSLFDGAPVALALTEPSGRLIDVNDAFANLLGYERSELLALAPDDITRPDDLVWKTEWVDQEDSSVGPSFRGTKTFKRKDGSVVRCRLLMREYRDSNLNLSAVIFDSETEERDTHRNTALLGLSSETITMVDPRGRLLGIEGFNRPILGYPAAFWRDHTILDIVDPAERSRLFLMGERVLQIPGSEVDTEVEVAAADGTTRTMTARVINCLDHPAIGALVLITRDVTRYRLALDELQRRSGLAEQIADAQTRLLATVSHELRNPLHAVRGMAELLAAELLPQHAVDLANSLVRQLDALAGVTNDLLDAAQIEVVPAEVRRSRASLREVVGDAVDLCRAQVRDRPISVVCTIDDSVPDEVLIDSRRLRQIVANLVGNAGKFTAAGTIEVTLRAVRSDLLLTVRDTGVGIPENELESVLEPFRCGSTAGTARGAGLGLSIVSRMVTALGGTLDLTSEVGVGTRFELCIPYLPAPPTVEVAAAPPSRELTGTRVLVVEDSIVNQQLARAQLERLGMTSYIVSSGEQAIEALSADPDLFDVVVLDEQLPGMSGTETVQALRALSTVGARIPVVGMSASTSPTDRDRFIESGMDEFIAKPASLTDIERTIALVLDDAPSVAPTRPASAAAGSGSDHPSNQAPVSPPSEALDHSVLDRLSDEIGLEGTEALMRTFLAELPQRAAILNGAADVEADTGTVAGRGIVTDPNTVRRVAHTLRSSSSLLGLRQLSQVCGEIERNLTDNDGSPRLAELNQLTEFNQTVKEAQIACLAWLDSATA